jgi:hypothetical protein
MGVQAMKRLDLKTAVFILILTAWASAISGQNRFEGYSLVVEAGNDGACPVRYQPGVNAGHNIDVYIAGTDQRVSAKEIVACDGSQVNGIRVAPNNFGKWCFQGNEPFYDVKLRNGTTYLWYPITTGTGFYNVKDFRPVSRTGGPKPGYIFSDPADYTRTIKNAVAFVAARQGGTLLFPDGDYIVGTTDGNTRDPKYEGITLPSGINIQGASSNASVPSTNVPTRTSSTRIRLRNDNQTIFRIGGCTNQVRIHDIELLGNSPLWGEAERSSSGNYGIEAVGKWAINPTNGQNSDNSSQGFKFVNITFQNLEKGIWVHNINENKCDPRTQVCNSWHFDYIVVDHCIFFNNNSGIWINTFNTDWRISNSFFGYIASRAPGDGIDIARAGTVLIEQTFGGGYNYDNAIGGTFIWVGTLASLTVIDSESENGQRSIYMYPQGATSSLLMNVIGSIFDDKIELSGPMNFVSSGSYYGPNTFVADPGVVVTSTGDRFCYDPRVLPGRCKDITGKNKSDPGFDKATVMFRTGHAGEGSGENKLDGRANFFGYDVEIGNGVLQLDSKITFRNITELELGSPARPQLKDGAFVYCKDCKKNSTGICSQGKAGVDGAFAKRINGQWRCD